MNYDHVSLDPKSPHYLPPSKTDNIGVKLNGKERKGDVHEFCVSEGWIRVQLKQGGRLRSERGKLILMKLRGEVKIFNKRQGSWKNSPSATESNPSKWGDLK